MSRPRPLRVRLEDFDGTHVGDLEALAEALATPAKGVHPEIWDEAVDLAVDPEGRIAAGATWLIRWWADSGRQPTRSALHTLSAELDQVTDQWARLHLVQALPSLSLPEEVAPAWAAFCRIGMAAEAPFLRAWSVNGLVHLATIDPSLRPEAEAALKAALGDPKASVRARARKILEAR